MSKHKHHPSPRGDQNASTTAHTEASTPPPSQEKTMETAQDQKPETEIPPEVSEPTAKQLAAAEEVNQVRALKLAAAEEPLEPLVPITSVAAKGYDALHEAFRVHNENAKKAHKEYVPPPRTERQMSALEEELQAGARAVERSKARQAAADPNTTDLRKEGFNTPVYRPNDVVPDPLLALTGTGKAGLKPYSPDV